MKLYDVSTLRAQYIKPDVNLNVWAAQHHPRALCNASLYGGVSIVHRPTGSPVGTIFEGGKCVSNQGNGYGFGIENGKIVFGAPWEKKWADYLTGYTTCVQNGVYVAPTFNDPYVFPNRLARIGMAKTQDGRVWIAVDDYATLREFSLHAIAQGVVTLSNLDGGASRHLVHEGRTIYASARVPYNAIAFFDNKSDSGKETNPYPVPTRNLLMWCRGEDVKWLQWGLNKLGYRYGTIDGIFGWNTWNALYSYQKSWSRFPDGICGPNTRGHLRDDL